VCCAPSLRGESFGMVLLEGMACSTPVVASDIPGYSKVARAGENAVLVPPGDGAALAIGIEKVLRNPDLADRLVANGLERADEFSMRRLAERYQDIYRDVLEAS
jgi:phosphatidylinositol alpha-mannosyltransferase